MEKSSLDKPNWPNIHLLPGQIPIVENEIKRDSGEVKADDEVSAAPAQKLVTEMGTYVTQSALSSNRPSKKEEDR